MDLFRIQTSEDGDNDRSLGRNDLFNIHFGVVFDESSVYSVETKAENQGKFIVNFPPQYEVLPMSKIISGEIGTELTCKLFEVDAANGDLANDATPIVDGTCNWNYTIDKRGNSLQFDIGDMAYTHLSNSLLIDYVL